MKYSICMFVMYIHVYMYVHVHVYFVFIRIEARASISFVTFLTWPLNGASLYSGPGLYLYNAYVCACDGVPALR